MLMRGRYAVIAGAVTVGVIAGGCSSDDGADEAGEVVDSSSVTTSGPEESGTSGTSGTSQSARVEEYEVPAGSHPHDVAVAEDGSVWYTAQGSGELGRLTPGSGDVEEIGLGDG